MLGLGNARWFWLSLKSAILIFSARTHSMLLGGTNFKKCLDTKTKGKFSKSQNWINTNIWKFLDKIWHLKNKSFFRRYRCEVVGDRSGKPRHPANLYEKKGLMAMFQLWNCLIIQISKKKQQSFSTATLRKYASCIWIFFDLFLELFIGSKKFPPVVLL